MAGRRRTLNRMDLRAANEAAERRAKDDDTEEKEDEEEEDEEDDEASDDAGGDDEEEEDEGGDDEEEEAPKPKKKPAKPKAAKAPAKRTREKKAIRMRMIWAVFNNSNQRVAAFDYPKRAEAQALAEKLTTDKKSTHFVQPVKEPIEEKKEG